MSSTNSANLPIEAELDAVRASVMNSLARTSLGEHVKQFEGLVATGKMLRSRVAILLARASGTPRERAIRAAASIELIHGASLLHDDVIDGAALRRGASTFWREAGTSGAILLGDLFYCRAILLAGDDGDADLSRLLVEKAGEMCDAETRQELLLRGATPTWERCLEIAKGKTGSLFAYVAGACGGPDPDCRAACEASGYDVGTAYQIADDLLDATGDEGLSGKTLGTDDARGKITAVTALAPGTPDPVAFIDSLLDESVTRLASWPAVQHAWQELLETEIRPAMSTYTKAYRASS